MAPPTATFWGPSPEAPTDAPRASFWREESVCREMDRDEPDLLLVAFCRGVSPLLPRRLLDVLAGVGGCGGSSTDVEASSGSSTAKPAGGEDRDVVG